MCACVRVRVQICISACSKHMAALAMCFGKYPVLIRNTFNSENIHLLFGDSIVLFNSFLMATGRDYVRVCLGLTQ